MGMFSNLLGKILGHASASAPATSQPAAAPAPSPVGGTVSGGVEPTPTPSTMPDAVGSTPPAPAQGQSATPAAGGQPTVDISAVMNDLASKNSEHLDWKKSIVDLLKLVGMDSSLSARKELATELGYTGDEGDSAAMNVWLHKAVLKKLSENGGHVPKELLD